MAWPQSPQPAPAPPSSASATAGFPLDGVITIVAGALTFLFSFVRLYKVDEDGFDVGWSVWTTDFAPGLFGVGTWIPIFALVAAGIAMARWVVRGLDDREVLGFKPIQLQLVAAVFAFLVLVGYIISILFSGAGQFGTDFKLGLGALLLLLGTGGVLAGSVLGLLAGPKVGAAAAPSPHAPGTNPVPPAAGPWAGGGVAADPYAQPAPAPATWDPATQPAPAPPAEPQWQQPAAPAPEPQWQQPAAPAPQWQQPAAPAPEPQWQPAAPAPEPQWQPPAAPEQQWQPPASGGPEPAPWQPQPAPPGPQPEPGPLDPQPAPPADPAPPSEGGLLDPGTQVIPGPPPAPPPDDPQQPPPA